MNVSGSYLLQELQVGISQQLSQWAHEEYVRLRGKRGDEMEWRRSVLEVLIKAPSFPMLECNGTSHKHHHHHHNKDWDGLPEYVRQRMVTKEDVARYVYTPWPKIEDDTTEYRAAVLFLVLLLTISDNDITAEFLEFRRSIYTTTTKVQWLSRFCFDILNMAPELREVQTSTACFRVRAQLAAETTPYVGGGVPLPGSWTPPFVKVTFTKPFYGDYEGGVEKLSVRLSLQYPTDMIRLQLREDDGSYGRGHE